MSQVPAAGRQTPVSFPSGGQSTLEPVQCSAGSHTPAEDRHTVVEGCKASAGQSLFTPSQLSATSQTPADARHTAVLLPSGGQAALDPVQFSAASQSPAAARQTVLEDANPLAGHVELAPVHVSATSHSPATARHTAPALPAGCWHTLLEPLQVSAVHGLPSSV